jgi:hypothetical protein
MAKMRMTLNKFKMPKMRIIKIINLRMVTKTNKTKLKMMLLRVQKRRQNWLF